MKAQSTIVLGDGMFAPQSPGKRCLVTGAAGNIGAALCARLIAEGHTVIGLDNLATGHLSRAEALIKGSKRFRWMNRDGRMRLHSSLKVDWLFHLAALADIVPSINDPLEYHTTNVNGTVMMLEFAREHNVKRFIYAASSSCYGANPETPTSEASRCEPAYPYALTKYIGEQYVLHYAKVYRVPSVSLRLFNVYGPGFRTRGAYGAVFGTFLAQLAQGAPLTVIGDGTQLRDFTYVDDVVQAFISAAESNVCGEAINIGSGRPHSINYLTTLMGGPKRVTLPVRRGEPTITHADITKARELLNWVPQIEFPIGVSRVLEHTAEFKKAPLWTPELIEQATRKWTECLR